MCKVECRVSTVPAGLSCHSSHVFSLDLVLQAPSVDGDLFQLHFNYSIRFSFTDASRIFFNVWDMMRVFDHTVYSDILPFLCCFCCSFVDDCSAGVLLKPMLVLICLFLLLSKN